MNHKHNDDFGLKEIIYWNANSIGGVGAQSLATSEIHSKTK